LGKKLGTLEAGILADGLPLAWFEGFEMKLR